MVGRLARALARFRCGVGGHDFSSYRVSGFTPGGAPPTFEKACIDCGKLSGKGYCLFCNEPTSSEVVQVVNAGPSIEGSLCEYCRDDFVSGEDTGGWSLKGQRDG